MRPCPTYWTERSFLPPKHWRAASCMQSCPMNCSSTRPGDGYWIAEPLLRLGIEKASRFREASPVAPQDIPPSEQTPLSRRFALHLNNHRPTICSKPSMKARSEEHTSELQSLMRRSYAVF